MLKSAFVRDPAELARRRAMEDEMDGISHFYLSRAPVYLSKNVGPCKETLGLCGVRRKSC